MQLHAEEAVPHIANLQEEFLFNLKDNKNAPFVNISDAETQRILNKP
jgi:penicillin-binding protein 1A